MQWKNDTDRFGFIAITLHWLVPLPVFILFALGLWMTELDYYDSWYKLGPWWHKSIGVLLFLTVILRLFWRFFTPSPKPLTSHKPWEIKIAHVVHICLYLLLLLTMFSGYLISTADNRPIEVFDWFTVPATITSIVEQEDVAGQVHLIVASILIGLVLLHAAAALKHHFIDRDRSLMRMFGR
ncbi:MAG: cytochrome b [Gammaproteobacteria bacterium]|nr:cytochrome b [Gammaproteobacteria bacterium]